MNCIKLLYRRHFIVYSSRYLSNGVLNKKEYDYFDRTFDEMNVNSFTEIIEENKSDNKIKDKIQTILNEYEFEKQSTLKVPQNLSKEVMKELLELRQSWERIKFIHFLFSKEQKKRKYKFQKQIKEMNRKLNPIKKELKPIGVWDENNQINYGFRHNSMFQFISKSAVNRLYCNRLRTTALFGPKLVIDLDFDKYMKKVESRRFLQQLAFLYNYNKYETIEPFDLHFVNCNEEEISIREMSRYLPKFKSNQFMVTMHYNKSYLDVFPKEKLVYLSPHSEQVLTSVNDDHIYIIGGIIDKSYPEPITEIKAREDGIRSAKLPIDLYIKWIKGTRNLCINQVLAILHDWKITKDWEKTFKKNIPTRKIYTEQELEVLKFNRISKYV